MGVEDLRRRSTQLLGNMYRLEIAEAIIRAAGEPVTTTSVHEETGIKYPRVQEELKRLAEAGLLRAARRAEGSAGGVQGLSDRLLGDVSAPPGRNPS